MMMMRRAARRLLVCVFGDIPQPLQTPTTAQWADEYTKIQLAHLIRQYEQTGVIAALRLYQSLGQLMMVPSIVGLSSATLGMSALLTALAFILAAVALFCSASGIHVSLDVAGNLQELLALAPLGDRALGVAVRRRNLIQAAHPKRVYVAWMAIVAQLCAAVSVSIMLSCVLSILQFQRCTLAAGVLSSACVLGLACVPRVVTRMYSVSPASGEPRNYLQHDDLNWDNMPDTDFDANPPMPEHLQADVALERAIAARLQQLECADPVERGKAILETIRQFDPNKPNSVHVKRPARVSR